MTATNAAHIYKQVEQAYAQQERQKALSNPKSSSLLPSLLKL